MADPLPTKNRENMAEVLTGKVSELVAELERQIVTIDLGQCLDVVGPLAHLKALTDSRIMVLSTARAQKQTEPFREHYLTVLEVCERFHVTPKWIYQNKKHLPHSQPTRKTLRFPERAIERHFASKNKCEEP